MPPRRFSRHSFTTGVLDLEGRKHLTGRIPYTYKDLTDNWYHEVKEGDTLYTIAGKYYRALPRGCGLWWIIADFQLDPIHDPTLKLEPGRVVVGPSVRTVQERIFTEARRWESE